MSYYFLFPLAVAFVPSVAKADLFDDDNDRCFDENHKRITCPPKSEHQRIVAIIVSSVALFLIILGAVIYTCVKKRRAKRFARMDQPAAPQMEQGGAGQWAPPMGPPMGAPTGQWGPPPGAPSMAQSNPGEWAPPQQYIPPNPFQDQKI